MSDGKTEVTTENNSAYGPHGRHGETYEYIQSSSAAAPQETAYEGVF